MSDAPVPRSDAAGPVTQPHATAARAGGVSEAHDDERTALWSRAYILVCLSNFLSYANQTMLMPVLPLFLVSLGYTPAVVGVAIAAFSVTSFVSRPWMGLLVDHSSPRRAYVFGALVSGVASSLLVIPNLLALLSTRAFGGIGWAAVNTAGTAMAADLAPPSRRGEALGYFTMMISLAKTLMPAVGIWLAAERGFWAVFLLAGLMGIAAAGSAAAIHERPLKAAERGARSRGVIPDHGVFLPTVLVAILDSASLLATAFVVLYAASLGISDIWILFVASGLAAVSVRLIGRVSDRFGRVPVLAAGLLVAGAGLLAMLAVPTLGGLTAGAVMFNVGQGLVSPAALAMVVDVTPPGRRGVAMAFYTSSYPVGLAIGGLLWGLMIEASGYGPAYVAGGSLLILTALTLAVTGRGLGRLPSPS
jgi:MFS family permease